MVASTERKREGLIGVSPRQWLIMLVGGLLFFTGSISAHSPRAVEQNQENSESGKNGKELQTATAATVAEALEKIRNLIKEVRYEQAEGAARALLAEVEVRNGRDSAESAAVLDLLVEALFRGGKATDPKTRALAERAVATKEKLFGPDHPQVATSLNLLGILFDVAGNHAQARLCFEKVLAIREKAFGPDHPEVAKPLHNLGRIAWTTGDYEAAKPFLEGALRIREKAFGPEHPQVADTLEILANVLHDAGDYAGARQRYEQVLAIYEKALGPDHPDVASALNNLGNLLRESGDYAGAKAYQERALAIREKTLGPEHPETAHSFNNLGAVLRMTGDYAGAKRMYERALAIWEKANGPEHPSVATPLNNIADVLIHTGDYAAARPLLERALAVSENALGAESPEVATGLVTLAELDYNTRDYLKAKRLFERATAIWEKVIGPDYPELAYAYAGLSKVLAATGEPAGATTAALQGEKISRNHLALTARTLPERQALAYASTRVSGLDLALSLAAGRPNTKGLSKQEIFDGLIRSRALVLDEMAARHHTVGDTRDPEIARLFANLASVRQQLANLVVRGPANDPPERYRALLDKTRHDKEQAERALAEKSAAFRKEQARTRLGLEEIVAALPPESSLVAFARYRQHDLERKRKEGKPIEPVPSYIVFVLRSGETEPAILPLGESQKIDNLVSRWREQMAQEATAGGRSPKRTETAYRTTAARLRRKVWDPLTPHLHGAQHVFVVPDGTLHLVNFAALPVGETSYLVETRPLIHYLSAERDLVPVGARQVNEGLLAIGAPAFDETKLFASLAPKTKEHEEGLPVRVAALHTFRGSHSACGEFQSLRFEPIPASARETEELATLWKKGTRLKRGERARFRGAVRENLDGVLYLNGAGANEAEFKQQAPGKRVLHLATHGFFLGGQCASASDQSVESAKEAQPNSVTGENPLLLAGLALAGANHRQAAGPDEDDGILTAEEISSLDLEGVEWVVLSGCDTGIGEVRAGEGVFGLRRAFQVAGARTVIMSLWPVEDQAARQWMTTLYRQRFVSGSNTAESVRQASLAVLRQRRARKLSTHPFYWAGFVAAGDWR